MEQFVPAWTRLEQFLRGRYRLRARGNIGIGQSPAHQEQYAAALAYYGAPAGSVDAWHEEAMAEIARLGQRPDPGRAAQGDALSPASSPATRAVESGSAVPEFRLHLRLPAFDDGWTVFAALRLATRARENGSERWEQAVTGARDAASEAALDSGIHGRGWSREQALTFATAHLGAREADAVVDRVAAVPGRALAVFAGARKFAALQRVAEARLGDTVRRAGVRPDRARERRPAARLRRITARRVLEDPPRWQPLA